MGVGSDDRSGSANPVPSGSEAMQRSEASCSADPEGSHAAEPLISQEAIESLIRAAEERRKLAALGSLEDAEPSQSGAAPQTDSAPRKPLVHPHVSAGDWAKSLFLRAGVPLAFAALCLFLSSKDPAAFPLGIAQSILVVAGLFALWWVAHWRYALWRKANADDERSLPIAIAGRTASWLLLAFIYTLFGVFALPGAVEGAIASPGLFLEEGWGLFWRCGALPAIALMGAVRIASCLYRRWAATQEASEALWWIDAAARAVLVVLHIVGVVGIVVCASLHEPTLCLLSRSGLYGSVVYPELDGSWLDEFASALGQLAAADVWLLVIVALAVNIVWRRFALWREVRFEIERNEIEERRQRGEGRGLTYKNLHGKKDQAREVPSVRTYLTRRIASVVSGFGWAALAIAALAAVLSLVNPATGSGLAHVVPLASSVVFASPALPAAAVAFVAIQALWAVEQWWWEATAQSHWFLNGLAKLVLYVGVAACALGVLYALGQALAVNHVFDAIVVQMSMGLLAPTVWTLVAQVAAQTAIYVLIVVAVIVVAALLIAGWAGGDSGSGGGGGVGGGAGGSAGAGFGGGSSSKRQSVNDRYGRRLVSVEDEGIFGTAVRDRHGVKIGTAHEGFDGNTHVRIGDDEYQVRDALFGNDRIVSKNGEDVGRISESGSGDDRFRST